MDRTSLIHKARSITDAFYAIIKVSTTVEMMVAAIPTYLEDRVRNGVEGLAEVKMVQDNEGEEGTDDEKEKVKAVFEYVVKEGMLSEELYVELMDWMAVPYDSLRKEEGQE